MFRQSPPRSICILRLSALGDVTHVVPVVRTLQRYWPDTQITWVIGKFEYKLVGDLPGVTFITFQKNGGFKAWRDLASQLKGRRFDVLLHMQVAARANLTSLFIKANLRVGYDKGRAKDLHGLFINKRIPRRTGEHVVDCFFSFLEAIGLNEKEFVWDIPIPEEASHFAEKYVPQDRRNLIISPCASHGLRNWQPQGYATIADYAISRYGMRVLICGGPSEQELVMGKAIEEKMQGDAVNLVGKDTIKRLLAMIDRADLVVSPDSGPAHMASSTGTPVIGLYAASNVQRSGPYNSRDWCVDRYDSVAREFRGKAASELKWGAKLEFEGAMDLIETKDVIAKIDEWAKTLSH